MSKKQNVGLKQRLREADPVERTTLIDELPYEVGFGKPPKHRRFSSEHQPARRRRRRGTKSFITMVQDELAKPVEVTEAGRRRRVTKGQLMAIQLINNAVCGDNKACKSLFELMPKLGQFDLDPPKPDHDAEAAKAQIRAQLKRLIAAHKVEESETSDP